MEKIFQPHTRFIDYDGEGGGGVNGALSRFCGRCGLFFCVNHNNFLIYASFVVVFGIYAFANIIIMAKIKSK